MKKTINKIRKRFIKLINTKLLKPQISNDKKIFVISFQRNGTTSTGDFFEKFGFLRAGYSTATRNKWSKMQYEGKYEDIFNSKDFINNQVFEDNPWWTPGFYRTLYSRFPDAKFILFVRDSQDWFNSMVKHSGGKTLGNTRRHVRIYNREDEFNEKLKSDPSFKPDENKVDNLLSLIGWDEHYKQIYENHNKDVISFFTEKSFDSLLVLDLYDSNKWQKVAKFIGFEIPENFEIHSNKSN